MGKKHNWAEYYKTGDTIEIIIRDSSGARRERWTVRCDDTKRLRQIVRTLKEKWDIDLMASMISKEKDLSWLE